MGKREWEIGAALRPIPHRGVSPYQTEALNEAILHLAERKAARARARASQGGCRLSRREGGSARRHGESRAGCAVAGPWQFAAERQGQGFQLGEPAAEAGHAVLERRLWAGLLGVGWGRRATRDVS